MPHNERAPDSATGEKYEAEVIERPAISSGEPVWQAQICLPQPGASYSGRQRVFNVRGPPRKTQEQAERDAKHLTEVSVEGPKAVRSAANNLHRP